MDFPNNAPTNVHKLDGVLFVRWSVYVVHEALHEAARGDGIASENLKSERQLDHLQAAEAKLRKEGHHVFLDRYQETLWIFDLSGPSAKQDVRSDERKEPALVLGGSGCKQSAFGSLRASDLADPPPPEVVELGGRGKNSSKKFEGTNLQAFQANSFREITLPISPSQDTRGGGARTPNLPQDNAAIYKRIISAISMTIYHALACDGACIPFAPYRFLSPGLASGQYGLSELDSQFVRHLSIISLNVNWLSSGTLVISSHPEPDSRWINTTSLHADEYQDLGTTEVDMVILAPLGVCAMYKGYEITLPDLPSTYSENISSSGTRTFEPPEDPTYVDRKSWKSSVAALLDIYGLEISSDTQWTWVLTSGSITENNRPNVVESLTHTILWPSHLCFYQAPDLGTSICDYSWAWERSGSKLVDPLADAESWFLAKNSRKEALEAQRHQIELEARTRAGSSSSDDGDSLSELFNGIRRSIDQQALSGIYPTPPDGDRSQAINVMAVQELDTTGTPDARITNNSFNNSQQDLKDNVELTFTSPDAEIGLGEYDHLEGDDLFGDMNSDMFTANGITEADFNFFDQPASVYEATPNAVLADEELPSYTACMSSDGKPRQPSDGNQELLASKVMVVETGPYGAIPVEATGDPQLVETPVNYSLPLSPKSSGKQARIQHYRVVGDESHSSKEVEKFTIDRHELECQDISYRGISFTNVEVAFDEKYGAHGRFETTMPSQPDDREPTKSTSNDEEIPRLGFVAEDGGRSDTEGSEETLYENPIKPSPRHSEEPSAKDVMQQMVNTDDSICRKRKRASVESENLTCITSGTQMQQDPISSVEAPGLLFPSITALLPSFEDDHKLSSDRSCLLTPSRKAADRYQGNDQSFIQLAQITAEQWTLLPEIQGSLLNETIRDLVESSKLPTRCLEDPLSHILPTIFPRSEQCNLEACLSIDDYPSVIPSVSKSVAKPISKREMIQSSQDPDKGTKDVFLIPPPNILVQRGSTMMEVSPTALSFWEQLGLEPSAGPKDVRALCIYPESQMMRRNVEAFLETIGSTYQSMRLGDHNRRSVVGFADGLVPVQLDGSTIEQTAESLEEICERLGELLQYEADADQPTIIYMVNPFDTPKALPNLCLSFSRILEAYDYGSGTSSHGNDLILKILPISMLASKTTIALPAPEMYAQVAMEVHSQCPPCSLRESRSPINSHSLFQLAESIPKALNFSLTTDPSTALVGDDVAYHLAYSWSPDGQWLSMALTNTCSSRHWTVSYCLGVIPAKWPTFRAVAKEVWDTMLELLDIQWGGYRLFIVKDSCMAQVEIDTWTALAAQTEPDPIRIVLVTVDPSPPLYYAGNRDNVPSVFTDSEHYATPTGTPVGTAYAFDLSSPITSSGWGHAHRAVDGLDTDPKARLVDKTDETWGAVAARSYEKGGAPMALASGFLVKRAGPVDADGLVMMGVSIVYAEKIGESLLKKILCMYRALGILAKARGITASRSVLPWHVAVARKAREGLDLMMQWVGT